MQYCCLRINKLYELLLICVSNSSKRNITRIRKGGKESGILYYCSHHKKYVPSGVSLVFRMETIMNDISCYYANVRKEIFKKKKKKKKTDQGKEK